MSCAASFRTPTPPPQVLDEIDVFADDATRKASLGALFDVYNRDRFTSQFIVCTPHATRVFDELREGRPFLNEHMSIRTISSRANQ